MAPLSTDLVAGITMLAGVASLAIGIVMSWLFKPCDGRSGITALVTYVFTAMPLILLVYNCIVITWTKAVAENIPPETIAIANSPTLGVGPSLLVLSGLYTIVHLSSDLIAAIQSYFVANPKPTDLSE